MSYHTADITWEEQDFKLLLWNHGWDRFYTKAVLKYEFYDGDELIFEGADFSPGAGMNEQEAVTSCLSFFALQKGDTDLEYFDKYTPRQIEWRDSFRCEQLGLIVYEREERNDL